MNRGSDLISLRTVRARSASMRPRFMNRGSVGGSNTSNASRPGFNEAPIHESGKSKSLGYRCIGTYSFNEAPIHESGK